MAFKGDRKFLNLIIWDLIKDDGLVVAYDMGLNLIKALNPGDKVALLPPLRDCDLSQTDRHNFVLTPLMLETTDVEGQTIYVAVVSAYIAEKSDAEIAIRTAEHLAKLTGYPARPVVASRHVGDWLDELVESSEVFWHELKHLTLEKMEDPPETPERRALNDAATARLTALKQQGLIP